MVPKPPKKTTRAAKARPSRAGQPRERAERNGDSDMEEVDRARSGLWNGAKSGASADGIQPPLLAATGSTQTAKLLLDPFRQKDLQERLVGDIALVGEHLQV